MGMDRLLEGDRRFRVDVWPAERDGRVDEGGHLAEHTMSDR
jgi:hypothetical protein